jgi:hypothetical protein
VVGAPSRTRALLLCVVVALPLAGAAIACNAGDDIAYSAGAGTVTGEGGVPDEGGRIVLDSSVVPLEPPNDGGTLPKLVTLACPSLDPDGGCDPSAGMGCCLPSSGAGGSTADNMCAEQVQYFSELTKFCKSTGDVFLTCLASEDDNLCCWRSGANGTKYTTRTSTCAGGVESCDPNALGGASTCTNGQLCVKAKCRGIDVGACGEAPPCKP